MKSLMLGQTSFLGSHGQETRLSLKDSTTPEDSCPFDFTPSLTENVPGCRIELTVPAIDKKTEIVNQRESVP